MQILAPPASRDNCATVKTEKSMGIIIGCQRIRGTWETVNAMARNGYAVVRDGRDVRLIWSEAFEQWGIQ